MYPSFSDWADSQIIKYSSLDRRLNEELREFKIRSRGISVRSVLGYKHSLSSNYSYLSLPVRQESGYPYYFTLSVSVFSLPVVGDRGMGSQSHR